MSEQPPFDPNDPIDPAPAELPVPRLPKPPFWLIAISLVMVVATWLPLSITGRARVVTSTEPRIQILQDMGIQPKFREQQTNPLFADDRAMRPHVDGTVARGTLDDDDHFYRGFTHDPTTGAVVFDTQFPSQVKLTDQLLRRGQSRFNIYCYVCHGLDGSGNGPVAQRVALLRQNNVTDLVWTAPAVLTSDRIRAEPDGQLFNTISNGIRAMPSYGAQIPTPDRWAIVAYVRALQFSQEAPASVVPPGQAISEK
jgi:mono/diheme cytochrome c family protein